MPAPMLLSKTMSGKPVRLFEIPSPFLMDTGVVKLLEPPDSSEADLRRRLQDGIYDKPFVLEHEGMRSLYFNLRFIQSSMRLKDPWGLELAYTQKMMAFLFFNAHPRRILLLGLGGGSLAKFCHRHLAGARITAVEIDPHVIAFRDEFLLPPDDERLQVIQGDGVRYVAEQAETTDVILVDAFDQDGVSSSLIYSGFYENAFRRLSGKGILVMNIAGDKAGYAPHLEELAEAFNDRVIAMSVKSDGNFIVLAFKDPAFEPRWKWLKSIAAELQRRFGLDFPSFAQHLERGEKLRLSRRMV